MTAEWEIIRAARALGWTDNTKQRMEDAAVKAQEFIDAWQKLHPTERVPFLSDSRDPDDAS